MSISASDPTIDSLRRALDRHYAAAMESREHVPNGLVGAILGCLPPDIFNCIFLPADVARGPHLAITFKSAFRRYVTFAAEYWADLVLGHSLPSSNRDSTNSNPIGRGLSTT